MQASVGDGRRSESRALVWALFVTLGALIAFVLMLLLSARDANAAVLDTDTTIPPPPVVETLDSATDTVGTLVQEPVDAPAPVDTVVEPVVQPGIDTVVAPVADPVVEPLVDTVVIPVTDTVAPVVDPIVETVVGPVIGPLVDGVIGPGLDGVIDPVLGPVLAPVVDAPLPPGSIGPAPAASDPPAPLPPFAPPRATTPVTITDEPSALLPPDFAPPTATALATRSSVTSRVAFDDVMSPFDGPPPGAPLPFGAPIPPSASATTSHDAGSTLQLLLYALAMALSALLGLRAGRLHPFGGLAPRFSFLSAIERPG
jgi:hypothetical protein